MPHFLRKLESAPGLCVTERKKQGEPCTRACSQRNPQDAAGLSLFLSHSLTHCVHPRWICASATAAPALCCCCCCCWKSKASVLSQRWRWWWWRRERGGEREKADLRVPTVDKDHWNGPGRVKEGRERQMGREGSRGVGGLGWGDRRLSNLVWRWIIIRAASRLPPRVTAELVCEAVQCLLALVCVRVCVGVHTLTCGLYGSPVYCWLVHVCMCCVCLHTGHV